MPNLVLRKLGNFVALSDRDRRTLTTHAQRIQHFQAREDLGRDAGDRSYVSLVLEGWACRYKQFSDGRRQITAFLLPGDISNPTGHPRRESGYTLASITQARIARLSAEEMTAVASSSPALEQAFWQDVVASAAIQREWAVNLGRRTANERMAHLLCELAVRLKMVGLCDGRECEMPATQADLADALGLSAVHVSRTLQELRGTGLVELKSRRLTIHDENALHELALFDPSYLHAPEVALTRGRF